MGCVCSLSRQIENNADINIKDNQQIKTNLNMNNISIQNQKDKEDIIIETKIPETIDIELDKINKLKKSEEKENNEEKNKEKIKIEEEKVEEEKEKEKSEEEFISKNQYNQRVYELINQIRLNPPKYSQTILDNIKNIILENHQEINKETGEMEDNQIIIFKKKVKVNLYKGEESFREAAEILKNTKSMEKLKFNKDIVIPLPDKEEDIINSTFIRNKANEIRLHSNINVYFKEYIKNPEIAVLLMIVDDTEIMSGKKRECLLNPHLKYIGIDSKFIGKNFIAHFSFSK